MTDPNEPTDAQVDAALDVLRDLVRRVLVAALNVTDVPPGPTIHPLARPTDGNSF